jgi:hypothetical protein
MVPPLQVIGLGDLAERTIILSYSGVNRQNKVNFHAGLFVHSLVRIDPGSHQTAIAARTMTFAKTIALRR